MLDTELDTKRMQNKTYATLWKITGLVAIGLLIVTFILAYQGWSQPQSDFIARITSPNPTVYLRAEPSANSKIVTILESGSLVSIIDSVTNQNIRWVKIDSGHFTGWISETNIVFESR